MISSIRPTQTTIQPLQRFLLPLWAVALLASQSGFAAVSTWNGGSATGNNFSDSANWGGTAPASGNSLVFAGSTRLTPNNDNTGYTYGGISFNPAASAFTVGGNACTLTGDIVFNGNPATVVTQTVSMPLTISAIRTFGTQTNGVLLVNGGITASGSYFYKNFPGTMILGGANNFGNNNTLYCNEGTLQFGASEVITSAARTNSLAVNANDADGLPAVADLAGTTQTLASLTLGSTAPGKNGLTNILMDSTGGGVFKVSGNLYCYPGGSGFSNGMATISAKWDLNGLDRNLNVGRNPANAVDLLVSGPIINSGANAKGILLSIPTGYSPGVVMLTSTNNTYDGILVVRDNKLILGANNTLPASSSLSLASLSAFSPTVDLYGTTNMVTGLSLGANATTVAGLTPSINDSVGGGVLKLGSGNVTYLAGAASYQSGTATVSATLDLNGGNRSFLIADSTFTSVEVQVNGAIINSVGTAGILKNNSAAVLVLAGTNTYNGDTTINGGTLQIGGAGLLGSGSYAANINLGNGATLRYSSSAAQTLSGRILSAGALTKDTSSSSILTLSGANNYTGTTTISAGLIKLNVTEIAGTTGPLGKPTTLANSIVLSGGGLQFSANNTYDYTTSGRLQLADGSTGIIDTGGQSVIFANTIGVGSLKTGALTKQGSGTLTLSGANIYTGNTAISGGTLALNGFGSLSSTNVAIATNATFDVSAISGSGYTLPAGTLTANINKSGATLTQGQMALGVKTLTYAGSLTVVSNANSDAFAAGNSFTLFVTNGTPGQLSGWFSSVSLPALAGGLSWDTNDLATAGILDVYTFTTTALTASTLTNTTATILASKLANHSSSAKAGAVYPTGWRATAAGATLGTVSFDGSGNLVYTAGGTAGTDNFTVTLYDGHGSQTMAVSVTVSAQNVGPQITPTQTGSQFGAFTASGIPGITYIVQLATSFSPANWSDYDTVTADSFGMISYTDTISINGHGGAAYYRLKQQ